MQNFRVIMVDDALSAFTEQEHIWALQNWMLFFGDVLSTHEVDAILSPADVAPPSAAVS
jgi:isochorismate hydrolase